MKYRLLSIALTATALLLNTSLSFSVENKAESVQQPAGKTKAAAPDATSKTGAKHKAAAKIKLVDINSAKREQLKKLPGIGNAEADSIIAHRPYGSKAWLVSHNVIPMDKYPAIKDLVIAKQPFKDAEQNAALYAPKTAPKPTAAPKQ